MASTVTMLDGVLRIELPGHDATPKKLSKALSYTHKSLEAPEGRPWMRKTVRAKREMFTAVNAVNAEGTAVTIVTTMPGFAARAVAALGDARVVDLRTPSASFNIARGITRLRSYQHLGFATHMLSGGGVLECPTGWGKTHCMFAVVDAYDRESLVARGTPIVLLTAPDVEVCTQTYAKLVSAFPGREVGIITSDKTVNPRCTDLLVCSYDSLHKVEALRVGVLLIDEIHASPGESRMTKLIEFTKAARYGYSATPEGRFDGADLVIEGIAGPTVFKRSYQEGVEDGALVPIHVVWVRVPPPEDLEYANGSKARAANYRRTISKCDEHNACVREVMAAVPAGRQALCILQHVTHMDEVMKGMPPGVRYVHGETVAATLAEKGCGTITAVSTKERQALKNDMSAGRVEKVVATYVWKQGVDVPGLRVLVSAGGGGSNIAHVQIPGRASRKINGKDTAVLVDFWHAWNVIPAAIPGDKPRPGQTLLDDINRRRVYTKLGFQETFVASASEIPFLELLGDGNGES